jgi:hypothetical protein
MMNLLWFICYSHSTLSYSYLIYVPVMVFALE